MSTEHFSCENTTLKNRGFLDGKTFLIKLWEKWTRIFVPFSLETLPTKVQPTPPILPPAPVTPTKIAKKGAFFLPKNFTAIKFNQLDECCFANVPCLSILKEYFDSRFLLKLFFFPCLSKTTHQNLTNTSVSTS